MVISEMDIFFGDSVLVLDYVTECILNLDHISRAHLGRGVGDVFQKFMTKLLKHERVKPLLSDEHFSVDGTLIEAWASHKSFKTDDDGSNFHGQLRKNDR